MYIINAVIKLVIGTLESFITCKLIANIKRYKGILVNYTKAFYNIKICTICLKSFNHGDLIYDLQCNKLHIYHKEAIAKVRVILMLAFMSLLAYRSMARLAVRMG